MSEENDPCGDCIVCQTKMIASIMSDEMRLFISSCVEATLQRIAHEVVEGDLRVASSMGMLMTVINILDPGRIEFIEERLADMGIVLEIIEEEA